MPEHKRATAQPCIVNKDEPKAPDKAMHKAQSLLAGFACRARISARDVQKAENPWEKLINGYEGGVRRGCRQGQWRNCRGSGTDRVPAGGGSQAAAPAAG